MSNSTCWLSFFDSSSRLLLPPNNLRNSLTKLFLFFVRGRVRLFASVAFTVLMTIFFSQSSFAQELIVNPGFESKLTGWQSSKSPIRTIVGTNPIHSGVYAAHIDNTYQDSEYFFQNLNASPFGNYTFSVWAMVHDASKWSSVGVNVYDVNWKKITSASVEMQVNSTSFQKYSKTFSVPSNARYLQVFGYTEWTVLKVDDFSLTQSVGGTPTGTVTKNCKIENFRKCDGTNVGYGPWLNILVNGAGGGSNNEYNVSALTWQEYSDNTATVKGTITKKSDATVAFAVDLLLSGKTTSGLGHFSPVNNTDFCVGQKGADWYFYPTASGTLIGTGSSVIGSQINVTLDPSMPWQVGTGGTTRFKSSFGSSAWVDMCVVKQPTTGKVLAVGTEGTDFYLEMPGCTPVVCNNVTSGGTIGTNQTGCGSFDPVAFRSVTDPTGGSTNALEIVWLKSTTSSVLTTATQSQWTTINGATSLTYDSGPLTQTTYFIRCSRRAGCTDYVGEANVITVTVNPSCAGKDPICLSRKSVIQNTSLCGDATKSYSLYFEDLKGNVACPSQYYTLKSGELTEFCDGTAVLNMVACVVGGGANDCITAAVNYSGRTGTPPVGSPVSNTHCTTYNPTTGDWYYYPISNGTFTGAGIYAGLTGTYTQNMAAFQVGTGGSLNDLLKSGGSSWFKINITNGGTNKWTSVTTKGDININLGTSTNIASVTATANPNSICKGSDVKLTAMIDAASKSANCSPSYSWAGSNGFTSTQATVTNTNVQGATTYTVTVTFTAVNGSKCSLTATTAVALNAVCCDNVTNGGQIGSNQRNCGAFDPAPFTNVQLPTGGTGTLEYIWLKSTTATTFTAENAAEWFPIAGTNSPTLDVNSISVTTAYQRCSRRAGCTDYDGETNVIVVIIDKIPTAPTTTPSAICGTGNVTLGATCTTGVAQWYAATTGGIYIATGESFTTPSISASTTYYVACKSPEGCESSPRTAVIAGINSSANPPTVTPATICGTGTVTLGATCTTGIVTWYVAATGGTALAMGASFTTPSLNSSINYYVSCKSSAGCESSRVEVKATVIGKITDGGKIQADESICPGKTPSLITSVTPASGGDASLAIEYIWLQTTSLTNGVCPQNIVGQTLYTQIPNLTSTDYQPGVITQTTCYIRCSRRAGCTDYIGGESNIVKKTLLANCQGKDPICLSRKTPVENTSTCGDITKSYGLYFADLKGNVASPSQLFSVKSGEFTEFCDGTAVLNYTACVTGGGAGDCINVVVNYSGRTGTPPVGSPVPNTHCTNYNPNTVDWYYYPTSNGTFTGAGIYAGMTGTYTQNMGAFQVGTGGSLNDIAKFGASSWFKISITNGGTNNWSTASKDGDININLGASTTIASVTASANPKAICSGDKVDLTATIELNSKSANCSPSYSWVGSNGFTSTQATVTNTNVTTSTTYTVTVTFTAINGSKCSVTATTGVTATPIPNPPTVTPVAICGTGTVTLGATCTTGTPQWYSVLTGSMYIATGASYTTPSISASTTYYVSCKSAEGCESSRIPVTATVNSGGVAPTVTPATICGTGTVTLGATCTTGTAQWYVASAGGNSIATGVSFTTPSLTTSTTYYVSCKSSAGCESVRVEVKATVIGKITDGGKIQADETLCLGGTPAKITSVSPASGGDASLAIEYLWLQTTSLTNGVCPLNIVGQTLYSPVPNTNTADYQPGAITVTTCYIRCARRAGCTDYIGGESNTVKKTVEFAPNAPTVTPSAICGTGTVTLGTTCTTGTAQWYAASTGGNAIATGASFTTPSLTISTTYYVSCKTTAGGCESARTPVTATINSGGVAPTVTPATICGTGTVTLGATCTTGTATWYAASTGGNAIATGVSFTTPSLTTTTLYYVSCKSSAGCESLRVEVKATVIGKITDGGKIQADETLCSGGTPAKITSVTTASGGDASLAIEYLWLQTTSLTNGVCPLNIVGQTLYSPIPNTNTADYQPGAITVTTCYIRCARRAGCTDYIGGESNIVKKTVTSPFTISATTNPNAVCSGTTVNITVTTTATGTITYAWAGPNGFTANTKDVSIPNATLLANGIYTVSASNGGGCSAVATVNVKVVNCLKIGDLVFNDKNNNGKQDAGELGIAGVTVKLFDSANNQVGSSTTTDANGNYLFSNLPSGNYVVEISAPVGYKSSTGTNGSATGAYEPATSPAANVNNEDNGTTTSGQIIRSKPIVLTTTDNTNVDFGLFRTAKLGDTVFRDFNGDGIQDAGEIGVAGVTVKLYDSANNVIATTTTDANGKYLFDNLTAGNYTVEFVKSTLPSGFNFSPQGATTTPDKDSDANVTMGKTGTITLAEGQTNNDIDAGVTTPCDIDKIPPVLTSCPYDVLIKTRGTSAIVSWIAPTATDNCGTPVVTSTNASGSQFPVGTTTVTYIATDAKGNKTTCSFNVTVVKIITCDVDTQAPVFYDCPTDINLLVLYGTPAIANWDHPSVGDNCGIPSVTFNYSPGQVFAPGVTTVIYTAKDAKGNTSYCMFKVTVNVYLIGAVSPSKPTSSSTPITGAMSSRVAATEEVKVGDEVSVYPNPSSSDFSIELSSELMKANSSVEVSVFSMIGNTQFTQTATGTERVSVKVPVQDMPNGTYFVNVGLDNGRMIIKKLQIVK
jgi:hypothetical protein